MGIKKEKPQVKRRVLTDEEKFLRDKRRAEAIRKKRVKREKTVAYLAVFLVAYTVVLGIIAGYGLLSFNSVGKSDKVYSVSGMLGEERVFNVPSSQASTSYGLHVPFSTLTKLCPLSVAGDGQSVSIILPQTGDYIKCFADSSSVWVNDSPCRLTSPVLFKEDDWLIPVELLEHINGLDVVYGDDQVCRIVMESKNTVLSASHSLPVGIGHIEFSPLYDTDYIYGNEDPENPENPENPDAPLAPLE